MATPLGMPTARNIIRTFRRQGLHRAIFGLDDIRSTTKLDHMVIGSSREGRTFHQLHCAVTLQNSEATELSAVDHVVYTCNGVNLDQAPVIIERT
jgi:hypothetical protein